MYSSRYAVQKVWTSSILWWFVIMGEWIKMSKSFCVHLKLPWTKRLFINSTATRWKLDGIDCFFTKIFHILPLNIRNILTRARCNVIVSFLWNFIDEVKAHFSILCWFSSSFVIQIYRSFDSQCFKSIISTYPQKKYTFVRTWLIPSE